SDHFALLLAVRDRLSPSPFISSLKFTRITNDFSQSVLTKLRFVSIIIQSCRGRKQNTRTHDKKGWSKSAQKKCPAMRTLAAISLLSGLLLGQPSRSQAGCGCDKPPPAPAAVIPNFAPGGTRVTLFYDGLQPGQQWTVTFQRGSVTTSAPGFVVSQRAITDPTGQTL